MQNEQNKLGFTVEDLPELDTKVGISHSSKQEEVGGGACLGIAAGIALYTTF